MSSIVKLETPTSPDRASEVEPEGSEKDESDPILVTVELEPIISLDSASEESEKDDPSEPECEKEEDESELKPEAETTKLARPYNCGQCGRSYKLSGYLKRHIQSCNPREERIYICTYCGMNFNRSSDLYHHNFKHKNDMKHKCKECTKTFNRKNTLERHMLVHSGEKPYRCEICSKQFTQKQNLLMHVKVHNGERDHKCTLCEKTFITKSKLRLHSKKHFKFVKEEPELERETEPVVLGL